MYDRKYPRTLKEAFGPDASIKIDDADEIPTWEIVAGYVLAVIIGVALACMLFLWMSE